MELLKVLILEDSLNDVELIKNEVKSVLNYDFDFRVVMNKRDFEAALINYYPDIILSDYNLPQFNGMKALELSVKLSPLTPFIIVTGTMTEEAAADSILAGAWDYVVKERLHRLPRAMGNSLKLKLEKRKSKKAEEDLKLIKDKTGIQVKLLYDAIDRAPSSIIITSKDGDIQYVNPKFEEVSGYDSSEVVGKNPRILKSDIHDNAFYENIWNTIISGKEWKGQIINKTKNNKIYWEEKSIAPIYNKKGEIIHFVAISLDITQLKEQEKAVKESENWYKTIFENTGTATAILNNDFTIYQVNSKFEELTGYSKKELEKNMKWTELISPEDKDKLIQNHRLRREKGEFPPNNYEFGLIDSKGITKDILLTAALILDTDKSVASLLDISNRKNAEKELLDAKNKAEESDKLKSSFLASMSHELRTPLNAIIGFSSMINDNTEEAKMENYGEIIHQSGEHLLSIIESIFEISMLQTGQIKASPEVIGMSNFFRGISYYLQSTIKKENKQDISIIENKDKSVSIYSDKQKLNQLLINLLNNAVKYTEKGEIEYGYSIEGKDIHFFVRDTGIGIEKDKLSVIFQVFRQIDDSHSNFSSGVGLGLSISQEIATLLGGKLWLESELNIGSTFHFLLPNCISSRNEKKDSKGNLIPDYSNLNILIVEDDKSSLMVLQGLLKLTNCTILTATNGSQAIESIEVNKNINLVLMDIKMPEMSGTEATRKIHILRPELPIIAQTAYALQPDEEQLINEGFNGYMKKPIRQSELYKSINKFSGKGN